MSMSYKPHNPCGDTHTTHNTCTRWNLESWRQHTLAHHHYIKTSHAGHGDKAGTHWGPKPDGVMGLVKNKTRQVKWGGYGGAGPGPKPGGCTRKTYTPRQREYYTC
jgi:hypothetical protein